MLSASKKASFVLWAPTSSSVVLNLYNKDQLAEPTKSIDMNFDAATGTWTVETNENIDGWFYDYTVTNNRGTNKVLDPYAKSMAAYRGGVKRVFIPYDNLPDIDEVDQKVRENLEFIPVKYVSEIIDRALLPLVEENTNDNAYIPAENVKSAIARC